MGPELIGHSPRGGQAPGVQSPWALVPGPLVVFPKVPGPMAWGRASGPGQKIQYIFVDFQWGPGRAIFSISWKFAGVQETCWSPFFWKSRPAGVQASPGQSRTNAYQIGPSHTKHGLVIQRPGSRQ